jgi:hypothetical protein
MTGRPGRSHHQGDYAKRAALVRAQANANPDTRCGRCGQPARPDDPWTAGHIIDGQVGGALQPEHRSCNCAAGAARGNALREPRSERWW